MKKNIKIRNVVIGIIVAIVLCTTFFYIIQKVVFMDMNKFKNNISKFEEGELIAVFDSGNEVKKTWSNSKGETVEIFINNEEDSYEIAIKDKNNQYNIFNFSNENIDRYSYEDYDIYKDSSDSFDILSVKNNKARHVVSESLFSKYNVEELGYKNPKNPTKYNIGVNSYIETDGETSIVESNNELFVITFEDNSNKEWTLPEEWYTTEVNENNVIEIIESIMLRIGFIKE